jgi:hypothetical protein
VQAYLDAGPNDQHEAKKSLRGVRVKVTYLDDRVKTIKGFGKTPFLHSFQKTVSWKKDPKTGKDVPDERKPCTVYKNLVEKEDAKIDSDQIKNLTFACANIGGFEKAKQEWYPIECLDILPHQPYTGGLPAQERSKMIDAARIRPGEAREKIRLEGLQMLGARDYDATNSVLNAAGVSVFTKMAQVPIRTITMPRVQYADDATRNPKIVEPKSIGR